MEITYVKHQAYNRLLILIRTALCSHLLTQLLQVGGGLIPGQPQACFCFPLDLASGQLTRATGCLNFPGTCGPIQELWQAFGGAGGGQGG